VKNLGLVPAVPAADHDGEHHDGQQENGADDQETSLQDASRLPQGHALKHQKLARMDPRSVKSGTEIPLAERNLIYEAIMLDNA